MRRLSLLLICVVSLSFAQNKQLLFGFEDIPQSALLNPAVMLDNTYFFGIPLLSHLHLSSGSSGANIHDIFSDDNIDFNDKLRAAVNGMTVNDFFTFNQQLELFSGGFATGNSYDPDKYISFGLYQETDIISYFPKDYAILMLEGNQTNLGRIFNFGQLNLRGEVISTLHLGMAKKINPKLTLGLRGKIYSSIFNFSSINNKGTFVTTQGENNFLRHDFNLDMELNTSGFASLLDDDNSDASNDLKTLRKRLLFGGNLGLGFDVGVSYKYNQQWRIDASLLDVGFIRHKKDIENYKLDGQYIFEGINPLFQESGEGQTAEEYWEEVEDEFRDLFDLDSTNTKAYTTWRPIKLNAAITYQFGEKIDKECNCLAEDAGFQNAFSMQLYAIKRPKSPQVALTLSYYRKLIEKVQFKASYTADSYSFTNLGLGLNAAIGGLNVYVLADNFLKYSNLAKAQSLSLQLGMNYVVRRKKI